MKKLLFVTTLPPYPDYSGGRQRSLNFILELSNNFQVTLLFPMGENSSESVEYFEKKNIEVVVGFEVKKSIFSYSDGYFRSYPFHFSPFIESVESDYLEIVEDFDVIYIDHLHMAPLIYLTKIDNKKFYILDNHNIESTLFRNYFESLGGIKSILGKLYSSSMKKFEKGIIDNFSMIITAGNGDREQLIRWGGNPSQIKCIENGAYPPLNSIPFSNNHTILYMGALNWEPNILSLKNYYKKVHEPLQKEIKNLKLIIAGSSPSKKLYNYFKNKKNVEIIGNFNNKEDIYIKASLIIAPSIVSGGTKIKVIESMLYGRKVVTTKFGSENLTSISGVYVSDNFNEWKKIIKFILENQEIVEQDQLKLSIYHWENIRKLFKENIISCIG